MGTCPDEIKRLIDHFDLQSDQVRSPDYNETLLRIDFVNPLFTALGWDIDNKQHFAEQYREVVHEDKVKVAGQTKAPDYSFRIGGVRKFFLEAKKPSVNIKVLPEPAYQLRRYGWSAKLAVSLLTDFEEFAIYDCRIAPKNLDKAATARREYITYHEYPEKWDFLVGTFSKDAVQKGEFDRYCNAAKGRGRQEFDDTFLEEIEQWRLKLAQNLALRNVDLDESMLNFSVQRIIDRIIFLRIAEDRGTESTGQLQALLNGEKTYERLGKLFRDADARYNSGLFHFSLEKGRDESPDTLTPSLAIDDKTLKDIIRRLYYPDSPYEFTVVTADILGSVYERFLGKVITLTSGHRAKLEEKPEVRKAGGVYYTPTYIVDYIVKNTVGKLLDERATAQSNASVPRVSPESSSTGILPVAPKKRGTGGPLVSPDHGRAGRATTTLKILDPACGSGSFLIGAYQYLLDWHLAQYTKHEPEKLATGKLPVLRPGPDGGWRLTIAERKRILLDNIHGVDLDAAAVEVTKLNLLLKCLEGETSTTLGFQQKLFRERALPDLGHNILCGNSLIGTDIMATDAWKEISENDKRRINPFDYARAFSLVLKSGGFDVVIGNPPYGYMIGESDEAYFRKHFKHQDYQLDFYQLFLERSLSSLLRSTGRFGMIIPSPWLTNLRQKSLRKYVVTECTIESIVHFSFPVFAQATVDTEVVLLSKPFRSGSVARAIFVDRPNQLSDGGYAVINHLQDNWSNADGAVINVSVNPIDASLAKRLLSNADSVVEDVVALNVGIKPYQVGKGSPPQTRKTVNERPFDADRRINKTYRICLRGRDIGRFYVNPTELRYLSYGPWLAEPRPAANFDAAAKIIMRQTGDSLVAAIDDEQRICMNNLHVLVPQSKDWPIELLLGCLNSKLLNWYYQTINPEKGEALAEVKRAHIGALPLPPLKSVPQRLIEDVRELMALQKRLPTVVPNRREQLQREIDATDRQIDQLVYELYGLTDDEIRIVEEATR